MQVQHLVLTDVPMVVALTPAPTAERLAVTTAHLWGEGGGGGGRMEVRMEVHMEDVRL